MCLPTQNRLNDLLAYDQFTGKLHWRSRRLTAFSDARSCSTWSTRYAGKEAFTAKTSKGYRVGSIDGKLYRASRVIYKMMTGIDPDKVDHVDGNPANDRWSNLRDVTNQQNARNMKKPSNNTSGTIGVCWAASKNKWEAKIKVDGKTKHLGRFTDINLAIAARKQGERDHGFHPNHGR